MLGACIRQVHYRSSQGISKI